MLQFRPQPISRKLPFSRFRTIEQSTDFYLQKRKKGFRSKEKALYRIVSRDRHHGCHYQIASSSDLNQLYSNEWKYLIDELGAITPTHLPLKERTSWLLAHLMHFSIEMQHPSDNPADIPVPGPDISDEDDFLMGSGSESEEELLPQLQKIHRINFLPEIIEDAIIVLYTKLEAKGWSSGKVFLIFANIFLIMLYYDWRFFFGIILLINLIGFILFSKNSKASDILVLKSHPTGTPLCFETTEGIQTFTPGYSIPFTSVSDSSMPDGHWTQYPAEFFNVRTKGYLEHHRKAASDKALYDVYAYDLFSCNRKYDNIGRVAKFDVEDEDVGGVPSFFILNVQLPAYEPTLWGNGPVDGSGWMFVFYLKIKPWVREAIANPTENKGTENNAIKLLKRFIAMDPNDPLVHRLKGIVHMDDVESTPLSAFLKPIIQKFNSKPFLLRPQVTFYRGSNYFECDLDIHRFKYFTRKVWYEAKDMSNKIKFQAAFTLEGHDDDELPEQILAAWCGNKIDWDQAVEFKITMPPNTQPIGTGAYI